jgi:hypothetical protein
MAAKEVEGVHNILEEKEWKAPIHMMSTGTAGVIFKELCPGRRRWGLGTRGNMEESASKEDHGDFCRKGGLRFEIGFEIYGTFDGRMIRGKNL